MDEEAMNVFQKLSNKAWTTVHRRNFAQPTEDQSAVLTQMFMRTNAS
jgi:hypothetical protein